MKEFILDLRNLSKEGGDALADHPARITLETILLDNAGKIIRVRVSQYTPPHISRNPNYRIGEH